MGTVLAEPIAEPADTSATALLDRYETALAAAVEAAGVEAIVEATGLDRDRVEAVDAGAAAELALADAAAILAVDDDTTAETILLECRDRLLLGMSSAMLTVDRIAADVSGDLDPKEAQAKIEGRHPMTVAEYARLHHYIAAAG